MESDRQQRESRWPRRLAVALALVTFPLIWVGGLVTTYDAGMAVPDWPGTYGYNLLRYPWQTWLAGPWDLFIEHGHRLLGATAGFLAIALVSVVMITDRRRWLIPASFGALALVIFQGLVGVQIALGLATYVAKYAFPAWLGDYSFAANFVVHEKSLHQSLITTAHVANGSLILFIATVLAVRSTRLFCHQECLAVLINIW